MSGYLGVHAGSHAGSHDDGLSFETNLEDNRKIQLSVYNDGRIRLRGWGGKPGTQPSLELTTQVAIE